MVETQGISYQAMPIGSSYAGGGDGGFAGGLGGILIGALLGGGLLGNRDRRGGEDCVTPAQFIAGLNNVSDNVTNSTVLAKLGAIEAAIPFNEAQVQLALAGAQNAIQGQAVTNATASASAATTQLVATLNSRADVLAGINADGDRTRALIVANEIATLNRELGVAQSALLEERSNHRVREVEFNITNTNTATAQQAQQQAQIQAQFQGLSTLLAHVVGDIQAVKQGQVIFNSGTMAASGTQAAANTKVA